MSSTYSPVLHLSNVLSQKSSAFAHATTLQLCLKTAEFQVKTPQRPRLAHLRLDKHRARRRISHLATRGDNDAVRQRVCGSLLQTQPRTELAGVMEIRCALFSNVNMMEPKSWRHRWLRTCPWHKARAVRHTRVERTDFKTASFVCSKPFRSGDKLKH